MEYNVRIDSAFDERDLRTPCERLYFVWDFGGLSGKYCQSSWILLTLTLLSHNLKARSTDNVCSYVSDVASFTPPPGFEGQELKK